jgi:hypothetical protein
MTPDMAGIISESADHARTIAPKIKKERKKK